MSAEAVKKSPGAVRQAKHRAKMAAEGVEEVRPELCASTLAMLDELREARGGHTGPYTVTEYLDTSIRRDHALLKQQQGQLAGRICENCRKPLPRGCGGVWAFEDCLRAKTDQALAL